MRVPWLQLPTVRRRCVTADRVQVMVPGLHATSLPEALALLGLRVTRIEQSCRRCLRGGRPGTRASGPLGARGGPHSLAPRGLR